jgi:hypothetical protein
MVKQTFSSDYDQHDPKTFRESFGSFGTTTQPGANQLVELQTKIRQGVKHVELHLASRAKGQFGQQDVPDKYGFEQRRTIMQLAKLNKQTLSVHGSFDVTSFSGLTQNGFNEAERATAIKEIDETLSFAAETAKGGAVVFHIQGDIPSGRGDLNVSEEYLQWLKKEKPEEYKKIEEDYLKENPLERRFIDNIDKQKELISEFKRLPESERKKYQILAEQHSQSNKKVEPWEEYFIEKSVEKIKAAPDYTPYVVVGDKIASAPREQEIVDLNALKSLSQEEKDLLKKANIDLSNGLHLEDYQKLNAIFTNGNPKDSNLSDEEFYRIKDKVLLTYNKVLREKNFIQSHADKTFYQKLIENQIEQLELQKEDVEFTSELYSDVEKQIQQINSLEREIYEKMNQAKAQGDLEKVKELKQQLVGGLSEDESLEFSRLYQKAQNQSLTPQEREKIFQLQQKAFGIRKKKIEIMQEIGQLEFQKIEKKNELIAQLNEQKSKLELQKKEIKSLVDESFKKNTTAIGHLGLKALRYQLDLKQKAKIAEQKKKEINERVKELEKQYNETSDYKLQNKLASEIQKEKYKLKQWVGRKDYEDIDLIERPLYLAPENMLPGYGSLTSIEEFKATIRASQKDFAERLLSDDPEYVKIREDYEKETGIKITKDNALSIAKNHIGGTFDNAHGATWLKHFKRKEGETEEERIARFNQWFNSEAEEMFKEGIIKHVHFNDTQGKDDDHNLLGQGILDIHDLKDRLRNAGLKEAFIVEAGGRGANTILHLQNAWNIFNPSLFADPTSQGGTGYRMPEDRVANQEISDWVSVERGYKQRPQYSSYGMGYTAFMATPPQQGMPKGDWSGQGLL